MMSVLEYAMDVNKSVEEILDLCEKLQIRVSTEEDLLDQDDITLLDNEIQLLEDYVVEETDSKSYDDDDFFEKVESLAADTKLVTEKHKKKRPTKKENKEENKEQFLKDKKEILNLIDKYLFIKYNNT